MPILKIQPNAISNTESFVFGNVTTTSITANGVNLGTAVAEAFVLANNANKSTTSDTAPANPKVGDSWFDTVTNVLLRYTNDGVSNNWIDISGPQNAGYIFQSYSISSNTTSLNESGSNTSVALTVSTINNADGTTLYWTIGGSTPADFTDNANTGSVSIINNSGTIIRTLAADLTTEDVESFIAQLRTGSTSGPIVAIAPVITVADTSRSPAYKLYTWGRNNFGQLGVNDTTVTRSSPVQVGTDTIWSTISSYYAHTAGIKTDGTLWTWGNNSNNQLGVVDTITRSSPVQVGAGTTWLNVSVGGYHSIAVKTDGTLWSWGFGFFGQTGLNNSDQKNSPTQIGALTTWASVSIIDDSSFAIKTDGTIWSWGRNVYGQLGLNDRVNKSSPVQIGSSADWNKIFAGRTHTIAIKTNGTLWSWGDNSSGNLGLGNTVGRSSPTQVGTDTNWSTIAGGNYFTIATKTNGTIWAWGSNSGGQLGLGNTVGRSSPTQVGTDTNWSNASAGERTGVAVKTNGTLWAWGQNTYGNLGQNNTVDASSPVQVGTDPNWSTVYGTFDTLFAIASS
jgi:alpha-tubulin suppressor-like RCC1 family protein